jgi:hypothetical protein
MSEVTMTLYEALAKKKIYESRVLNIQTYRACGIKLKASNITTDNQTLEEAEANYQSGLDESVAVLNNLTALKAAINEANVKIFVNIAGKDYTIASAIARYRMLDTEEKIYRSMLNNINACRTEVTNNNTRYLDPDRISEYVKKVLGDSKKDSDLIDSTTQTYKDQYEKEIYDPLNTEELATNKLKEIAEFRESIHYKLTEANCKNTITVTLAD